MNAGWHERHPMPRGANEEKRLGWHLAHQNACGCRPVPAGLLAELAKGTTGPAKKRKKRNP